MSEDKKHPDKRDENIFEILDGIMVQLSRTKKMFMIMILTVLIIPPVALIVMAATFEHPFQERLEMRLNEQLQRGEITHDEMQKIKEKILDKGQKQFLLHPSQFIILAISLGWLGIGIRQWLILSQWDKKYQKFKRKQEEVDKELDDNEDEKDSDT